MFTAINREYLTKIIAIVLLVSSGILLVIKAMSISDAYQMIGSYLQPNDNTSSTLLILLSVMAFELSTILGRFYLGYCLFYRKSLNNWRFYGLAFLTFLSGFYFTGPVLSLTLICLLMFKGANNQSKFS